MPSYARRALEMAELDAFFATLQHRAFRAELWSWLGIVL